MDGIEFAKQKYGIKIAPRAYGDLEYKQRKNWNSPNHTQRERANLLFSRVYQGLYNLANNITPTTIIPTGHGNEFVYTLSNNIGRIIFKLIKTNDASFIYIVDFIWDYKNTSDSWWSIVEQEKLDNLIKESIHNFLRREHIL